MLTRPSQIVTLIVVIILLVLAAFFTANAALPVWFPYASLISTLLLPLPCAWAAKMWLGRRDAILLFIIFGVYALVVGVAAHATGFPYGHFGYSDRLGFRLFGSVPWVVAFAWTPLFFGAYSIAANLFESRPARIMFTTLALSSFYLVIDPGAVRVGLWQFVEEGFFYGVPPSNFAGSLLSAFAGAILLDLVLLRVRPLLPAPVQLGSSAFLILLFWTAFSAFAGMLGPALIGLAILCGMAITWRKFHYPFDDRIVLVDEDNNPLGTAAKLAAHNSETRLHRAFSVFIFNSKGELLLQQRALSKKTWPGVWSNSCCGHVMMHEGTAKAAARRLQFELGLSGVDLTIALPDFRYRAEKDGVVENELCPVLVGRTDARPRPNPAEVENIRWINWDDFLASLEKPGNEISPWAIKEVRLLAGSENFKKWFAGGAAVSGSKASV
ncbi:MAG TPA: isopentenyl-diphosphate Delta-isomerase [Pyrinomonadaceae bacterium]|nr:isopentenyl-diphosphate Delta-isomerase [Pyrinomonadaceae bacterium]